MDEVIKGLRAARLLAQSQIDILDTISGPNRHILKRQLQNNSGKFGKTVYCKELQAFALTLHYYSPAAYKFVRSSFDSCLPHPQSLSRWYRNIDGAPGFTEESFSALKKVVENSKSPLFVNLVIDEMAIKKHVAYNGHARS